MCATILGTGGSPIWAFLTLSTYSLWIEHALLLYRSKCIAGLLWSWATPVRAGRFSNVLAEFKEYQKRSGWIIAFIGASNVFYQNAREYTTTQFGTERVLNLITNDVLNERAGKRIIVQSKNCSIWTKAMSLWGYRYQRRVRTWICRENWTGLWLLAWEAKSCCRRKGFNHGVWPLSNAGKWWCTSTPEAQMM